MFFFKSLFENKLRWMQWSTNYIYKFFFFFFTTLLSVSHHHYVSQYFLLRQGLAESVFMFGGVEKVQGDEEEGSREIIV